MRLGADETGDGNNAGGGGGGGTPGNVATAYGHGSRSSKTLLFLALVALVLLFLKNSLTKDYQQETKDFLVRSGVDEEKIDQIVPKSAEDIKKEELNEKQQIEWLISHVKMLEEQLNATNAKVDAQYKELSSKINARSP
mmetsp:Transcript_1894/g.2590  ORF Transcript_1894/g.2590 Transcript_1894/m.2590 type:complete len:139 (-) Transcript_1894:239-655(-)|eukprot:CAMPEP_0117758196 /NCGR_PEP_ID=MMETSP0947-20121206/15224_1 /TAXON_ID=44440 /ORGANISM="Chattonella subsalsa, Strain CCMP2191" /LENGTH=138 /DNA_ID=CAMNT_0005578317 /DNA_START=26 /DNA_END=442 /DNA_ORIENTATION=-